MIHALCSASNLRVRAEKIKKLLFKQTHEVTFHILTSLGVVFSLSTLISKLSCAKIISWFKWDQLRWQKWVAFEKSWFSGRRYFSRLRRSWRLRRQISLDYITTAPPPNLTRLLLQYRQLRRLGNNQNAWCTHRVACVQTSPLPQTKSGEETSVNCRR